MARMTIGEYSDPKDIQGPGGVIKEPSLADQTVNFTDTAGTSAAFSTATRLIRVSTDSKCAFKIAANPTAVVTDKEMPAGHVEYFCVTAGHKISMIAVS